MADDVLQFFGVILVVCAGRCASLGAIDHLAVELVSFDLEIVEDLLHRAAQVLLDLAKQLEKRETCGQFRIAGQSAGRRMKRSPPARYTKCSSRRSL